MNKQILIICILATNIACNSTSTENTNADSAIDTSSIGEMKIQVPDMVCYSNINGKDTVYLKIEKFPNVVTGKLVYKLYEKDSNTGTIDGILKGDTLIADYTFMSEGQQSVRQVAFIITDSLATEGYSDMEKKMENSFLKMQVSLISVKVYN